MAKSPVVGEVKTRLTPYYSHAEALLWHEKMCRVVIAQAKQLFQYLTIATNDIHHDFWQGFDVPLIDQGAGDLGQRLTHVMEGQAFCDWKPLIFIGTDSPHMTDARLFAAADALFDHDVVIGPVEDGGYNLIGIAKPISGLFQHTDWGTPRVCAQTVSKAKPARICMLNMHYDIDTAEDLQRLLTSGYVFN